VTTTKEVVMVTTIGIDPHKATHTAVAINETETVLGELTVPAGRSQTKTLLDWAQNLDGDGRVWAVEAAGGLGYLLSQQLIASGEDVVDVPPMLASRVRVLGSGRSDKNDPNDARSSPRAHRIENPGGVPSPRRADVAATRRNGPTTLS
jgi:transposase